MDLDGTGKATAPGGGEAEAENDGTGKLVSSQVRALSRRDLRDLLPAEEIAEAVARRLGAALRDRRARRRVAARKDRGLHFRKTIRRCLPQAEGRSG